MEKFKRIIIDCSSYAEEDLLPLLEYCKFAGAIGHTMYIRADYDYKDKFKDFCFDGDGTSKIHYIKSKTLWYKSIFRLLRWWRIKLKYKIIRLFKHENLGCDGTDKPLCESVSKPKML